MKSCPICARTAPPRPENPSFPFCTPRCRAIDLSRWLGEEYRVPTDEPADASAPESRA